MVGGVSQGFVEHSYVYVDASLKSEVLLQRYLNYFFVCKDLRAETSEVYAERVLSLRIL